MQAVLSASWLGAIGNRIHRELETVHFQPPASVPSSLSSYHGARISRTEGLEVTISATLYRLHHGYCPHHLAVNVQRPFGTNARHSFASLLYAKSEDVVKSIMADLYTKKAEAARYIDEIDHKR